MREGFDPNSWLAWMRNVESGLRTRTLILAALEGRDETAAGLVPRTGMSYERVLRHLHLLEGSKVVGKDTAHRPYTWSLTGLGQMRLTQ